MTKLNEIQALILGALRKEKITAASLDRCGGFEIRSSEGWDDQFGGDSEAIVVHDGGPAAPYFNFDYCQYEATQLMQDALAAKGYRVEQCTSWYSAVYLEKKEATAQERLEELTAALDNVLANRESHAAWSALLEARAKVTK